MLLLLLCSWNHICQIRRRIHVCTMIWLAISYWLFKMIFQPPIKLARCCTHVNLQALITLLPYSLVVNCSLIISCWMWSSNKVDRNGRINTWSHLLYYGLHSRNTHHRSGSALPDGWGRGGYHAKVYVIQYTCTCKYYRYLYMYQYQLHEFWTDFIMATLKYTARENSRNFSFNNRTAVYRYKGITFCNNYWGVT